MQEHLDVNISLLYFKFAIRKYFLLEPGGGFVNKEKRENKCDITM